MSSYTYFAEVYDALTENVNYKVRSDYISDFFVANNINDGLLVDLACGTGSFTKCFTDKGFNVVGVDLSQEMLVNAKCKVPNANFILSNIIDFDYDEKANAVICCLDSVNHLTNENDVEQLFNNVYNLLNDNGVFVFDVNTIYKHQNILADNVFVFDEEDYYLVWENEQIDDYTIRILLDIFFFNGESYDRFSEEFCEKAFSVDLLTKMLENAGFKNIYVYDDLSNNTPKEDSERLYFVVKKE